MAKADKLLDKMRNNPRDWRLDQLKTVAERHDITWEHEGGSHCVFRTADGDQLSVPAKRPIKPVYVKAFLSLLD